MFQYNMNLIALVWLYVEEMKVSQKTILLQNMIIDKINRTSLKEKKLNIRSILVK